MSIVPLFPNSQRWLSNYFILLGTFGLLLIGVGSTIGKGLIPHLVPGVSAHTVPRSEILAYLNNAQTRQATGIVTAREDAELPRLLIIEVGPEWFKLPPPTQRSLAQRWRALWTHTVARGIVAILAKDSGQPVVEYRANGRIELRAPSP